MGVAGGAGGAGVGGAGGGPGGGRPGPGQGGGAAAGAEHRAPAGPRLDRAGRQAAAGGAARQ